MEFFKGFFGGKKEGSTSGTPEEEKKIVSKKGPDPSRRDFLKFTAGVAGTLALEKVARATGGEIEQQKDSASETSKDKGDIRDIPDTPEQRVMEKITLLRKKIFETRKFLHQKYFGKEDSGQFNYDLPLEQQVLVRKEFLQAVGEDIVATLKSITSYVTTAYPSNVNLKDLKLKPVYVGNISEKELNKLPEREREDYANFRKIRKSGKIFYAELVNFDVLDEMSRLIFHLEEFGSHGFVYKALSEVGLYKQLGEVGDVPRLEWNARMSYRTTDFLPSAEEIHDYEIDPFLSFSEKRGFRDASVYKTKSKWGKKEYQEKFRSVFGLAGIHTRLEKEVGLTFADACSLVKSVIEYKERGLGSGLNDVEILDTLIKERHLLEQEVWIDKDTNVIRYYAEDTTWDGSKGKNMFNREPMDEVLKFIPHKSDSVFEVEKDEKGAPEKFLAAIRQSRGKTFINPQTHGGIAGWYSKGRDHFKVSDVAEAFVGRAWEVGLEVGPEAACSTLFDVKMTAEACYAYDFLFKNLAPAMKSIWDEHVKEVTAYRKDNPDWEDRAKKEGISDTAISNMKKLVLINFEQLKMPRVVSYGQEGNVVYPQVEEQLFAHRKAFKKMGKLRGKDLLALQSEVYLRGGDMAFSGSKEGQIYQISELEREQPDKPV